MQKITLSRYVPARRCLLFAWGLLLTGCGATPLLTEPDVPAQTASTVPLIVLDSGHNPQEGGAISARGTKEVLYNDRFVAELAPALRAAGWQVWKTRRPGQTLGLVDRAQLANDLKADFFLSIHHDSVQSRCVQQVVVGERMAYRTLQPTSGYSLFVSKKNPHFSLSYQLAKALGKQLHALGRAPMLVHAGQECGAGRPLLDPLLGIYRYDGLAVLRHTQVPAVLLEVGVITDVQDEAYVSDAAHRQEMIGGIVRGIRRYLDSSGAQRGLRPNQRSTGSAMTVPMMTTMPR